MGTENIRQALGALRANWVRSALTMAIIAFGIMAVVGILTAIDAAIYGLNDNFSTLGANSLEIREKSAERRRRGGPGRQQKRADPIDYDEALAFEELFGRRATVALEMIVSGSGVVKYGEGETNPTSDIVGVDEDYPRVKSFELEAGRSITGLEARRGAPVAVIGSEIVAVLFDGRPERALGRTVAVGPLRVEVVGTFASSGQSMSDGADQMVMLPLQTARRAYGTDQTRYKIYAQLPTTTDIERSVSAATGAMRTARGLTAKQLNDFEIVTSDGLIDDLREQTSTLQASALAIGVITLLGAAIGLMNIMLVSVTERTREIGIAKALGASRRSILSQFLTEAIVVTQLGGAIGIVIGIAIGNVVALLFGSGFVVPWGWIGASFVVCLITGLLSGLYPAVKASRLDPIESLRYE